MAKHVPGHWTVNPENDFQVINKDWGVICHMPNEPYDNEHLRNMSRANAKLIAASPMMLEALKELVAFAIEHTDIPADEHSLSPIGDAREIIAQAEEA